MPEYGHKRYKNLPEHEKQKLGCTWKIIIKCEQMLHDNDVINSFLINIMCYIAILLSLFRCIWLLQKVAGEAVAVKS